VLVLLAAQTLGLLHGMIHNPAAAHAAADLRNKASEPRKAAGAVDAAPNAATHGFLAHLFSGHLGDADCRAYDQLSHFDAAPGCVAVVLPLVLTPFLLRTLTGLATARWHALFQARGPPSLR
jgi:hypothetical protein